MADNRDSQDQIPPRSHGCRIRLGNRGTNAPNPAMTIPLRCGRGPRAQGIRGARGDPGRPWATLDFAPEHEPAFVRSLLGDLAKWGTLRPTFAAQELGTMRVFGTTRLVARIEAADAQLLAAAARASSDQLPPACPPIWVVPFGGGIAAAVGKDSTFNKCAGLGFSPIPDDVAFAKVEAEYLQRNLVPQVEVSTAADPQLHRTLSDRGYRVADVEHIHLRAVADAASGTEIVGDIEIVSVDRSKAERWLEVMYRAFSAPEASDLQPRRALCAAGLRRALAATVNIPGMQIYLARRGHEWLGGAGMYVTPGGMAVAAGAATLPASRGKGVQSLLLNHRLVQAGRLGCEYLAVTVVPASRSAKNAVRLGFACVHARWLFVR